MEALRRCLQALASQTQAPDTYEVIVADDGSTDGTLEMLGRVEAPFALRALPLPHDGPWAARNAAVEAASGPMCVFLDDNVRASPGLLAAHAAAHARERKLIVVGKLTHIAASRDWYARAWSRDWYARAWASACTDRYERLARGDVSWADCSGANLSVARTAVLEVGGFSRSGPVSQAEELAFRLCERGWRPRYEADAHGTAVEVKRGGTLRADAVRLGARRMTLAARTGDLAPVLVGWFGKATGREVMLRRLVLALRVPPRALAVAGPLIPGRRRQAWFGFVSRYAFWTGVSAVASRAQWRRLTTQVPVLMYHAFDETGRAQRYTVSRSRFRMQLRVLAALRYRVVGLEQLIESLRAQELPRRAAVITIDDGYLDNSEIAARELRRAGYPAIVFLVAGRLGARNDWSLGDELAGRPMLSVHEAKQMATGGISVGAHTRSHPVLPEASDAGIRAEVDEVRTDLEGKLGRPVPLFSYPYGRFDDRAVAAARRRYVGACTTEPRLVGLGSDPFLLPRIEVHGTDSVLRFLRKLWLGGT